MISLFINPEAGKGRAVKLANQLEQILQRIQQPYQAYYGGWPLQLSGCSEAWVVGGDGTLNYFINHYAQIDIPLALFKGGTGDDFAWKLYGNISLEDQVQLVLNASPRAVDAGNCNGRLFVNSVGIGFDGEVLKSMGTIRMIGGHLGYLWIVLQKIFSFREKNYQIQDSNWVVNGKYFMLNIANAPRTGGGFMVSPRADIHDGELDLVLCNPLPVWKRLRYLPVVEKGAHLNLPFILHRRIKELHIDSPHAIYAQIDGDLFQSSQYNIHILPGHFRFRC